MRERFGRSRYALLGGVLLLGSAGVGPAIAQTVSVTVPGQANPYLAAQPTGATCCEGDIAPDQSPVQVAGIPVTPGTVLTFGVSGSVSYLAGTPPTDPPDGDFLQDSVPTNGIAGMVAPINALSGVFLDDSPPQSSPAPPGFDFGPGAGGTNFRALCPRLKEVFYIGDGLRGRGAGASQQFVVPAGATRLFLGTVDGRGWHTNSGAFSVNVTAGAAATPFADVLLNANTFRAGESLAVTLHVCNPPGGPVADLYVAVLLPDGDTIAFMTGRNVVGGQTSLGALASLVPLAVLQPGEGGNGVVIEGTLTAGDVAAGTYTVFAGLLARGALADNVVQAGEVLAVTTASFTFTP